MKVSVYKVETWRGAGPYNVKYRSLLGMHEAHEGNRPKPSQDGIPKLLDTEVCGFGSREDLDRWFQGYKRLLYQERFNIALYVVAAHLIRYGGKQLVFERGALVPVERFPMIRGGVVHR